SDRAARVRFHGGGPLLGVQGAGKALEVFRVRDEAQAKKKMKRRLKRAKEKASLKAAAAGAAAATGEAGRSTLTDSIVAGDELESLVVLRTDHRVRSFDFAPGGDGLDSTRVLVSLHNNSMEVWGLEGCCRAGAGAGKASKKAKGVDEEDGGGDAAAPAPAASRMMVLDLQGHRSDVRAVAVSSDGAMVASVSHGLAKAWSARTRQCVRSAPCGFGLTVAFAPGDRHLLVGTKEGNLQVVDLGSGEMIQDYAAHEKAIWSIDLRPDGKGLVSGSADRQV
ncbi:unnamed protein product, partial [Ectocarpus sp. 8 AP-2014]